MENAIQYGVTLTSISIYPAASNASLSLIFEDNEEEVEPGQK